MSACELMFNHYSHRKQRVKLGNNVSDWQHVYKGSAQGSIMGPLSYNMFTNDMFMILASHVVQLSSNFSGSKSFYFRSAFNDELQSSPLYR